MTKVGSMLQPSVNEFKPFIDDMSQIEKRVRECADIATIDKIKSGYPRPFLSIGLN